MNIKNHISYDDIIDFLDANNIPISGNEEIDYNIVNNIITTNKLNKYAFEKQTSIINFNFAIALKKSDNELPVFDFLYIETAEEQEIDFLVEMIGLKKFDRKQILEILTIAQLISGKELIMKENNIKILTMSEFISVKELTAKENKTLKHISAINIENILSIFDHDSVICFYKYSTYASIGKMSMTCKWFYRCHKYIMADKQLYFDLLQSSIYWSFIHAGVPVFDNFWSYDRERLKILIKLLFNLQSQKIAINEGPVNYLSSISISQKIAINEDSVKRVQALTSKGISCDIYGGITLDKEKYPKNVNFVCIVSHVENCLLALATNGSVYKIMKRDERVVVEKFRDKMYDVIYIAGHFYTFDDFLNMKHMSMRVSYGKIAYHNDHLDGYFGTILEMARIYPLEHLLIVAILTLKGEVILNKCRLCYKDELDEQHPKINDPWFQLQFLNEDVIVHMESLNNCLYCLTEKKRVIKIKFMLNRSDWFNIEKSTDIADIRYLDMTDITAIKACTSNRGSIHFLEDNGHLISFFE